MYGIVVLNYNSYNLTCELIDKLLKYKNLTKIVLVDNCSNDDFSDYVKKTNNEKITYIKNEKNTGYASGNNVGLRYLFNNGYEYGFIANPDVDIDEKTLENIYSFLLNHQDFGIVSSKRTIGQNGITGQYWDLPKFGDCLLESVYFGRKRMDSKFKSYFDNVWMNKTDEFLQVDVVGGAFFGCNLMVMDKVGYLNPRTFLWYEENIICYKMKKAHYKVGLLLNCSYIHNHIKKSHGNVKHNIYLKSKRVYCEDCLGISAFQSFLLSIFDLVGLIESKLIVLISKILK